MPALNPDLPTPRRRGSGGRPPRLHGEHLDVLRELGSLYPGASVATIAAQLREKTSLVLCDLTVGRYLQRLGLRQRQPRGTRPVATPPSPPAPGGPAVAPGTSYRYTDRHRREPGPGRPYPSDLLDEEWALVEPVLRPRRWRNPLGPGARRTLDAILYLSRTGAPWRYLPTEYPPWNSVAKQFYRWQARGVLERLVQVLRVKIRVDAGRGPDPSAAVIDSQSVKTTEKGGPVATTRARRSTAGSARSS